MNRNLQRPVVETPRLRGEPVSEMHVRPLHRRLYADPRVMATLGGTTRTLKEVRAGVVRYARSWETDGIGPWAFLSRADGRLVGLGGALFFEIPEGRVPGLVYHVASDEWGDGYATEIARETLRFGFESCGFPTIYSWTLPDNIASRRVMEKCGMVCFREGSFAGLPHVFYRIDASGATLAR